MRLFHSPASPFVRKVLVLAIERGIDGRLDRLPAQVGPVTGAGVVSSHNPAGKIPTLLLDDGTALFDSRVIVEYLDALPGGPHLLPAEPTHRLRALVLQSLADELTDAAVLLRYELALRPEALRWPEWVAGQWAKIDASLDEAERRHGELAGELHIGAVALACALGYLDFRFAERDWRRARPRLAEWYATFAQRPSMVATRPS